MHRAAKDQPIVTFLLSSTDHAELVGLLDETDARLTRAELRRAATLRSASGEVRMTAGCAEELLGWLRGRARAGRASSKTADLERALLIGRVAFALQRALAKQASVA